MGGQQRGAKAAGRRQTAPHGCQQGRPRHGPHQRGPAARQHPVHWERITTKHGIRHPAQAHAQVAPASGATLRLAPAGDAPKGVRPAKRERRAAPNGRQKADQGAALTREGRPEGGTQTTGKGSPKNSATATLCEPPRRWRQPAPRTALRPRWGRTQRSGTRRAGALGEKKQQRRQTPLNQKEGNRAATN